MFTYFIPFSIVPGNLAFILLKIKAQAAMKYIINNHLPLIDICNFRIVNESSVLTLNLLSQSEDMYSAE